MEAPFKEALRHFASLSHAFGKSNHNCHVLKENMHDSINEKPNLTINGTSMHVCGRISERETDRER